MGASERDEIGARRLARVGSLAFVAIAIGVALRIAMGLENFWLDEIYSLQLTRQASSAWHVLLLRHDNNHILNTVFLYWIDGWIGLDAHWIAYRGLSLVCGIAMLPAIARATRRWGEVESAFATAIVALSYSLVSASAQARGYAPALLCSVALVIAIAKRDDGDASPRNLVAIWIIAAFGILSHVTFVFTVAAAACWSVAEARQAGTRFARIADEQFRRNAVPALFLLALYQFFYRDMTIGGGPIYDRFDVVRQAFAQTMGLPRRGPLTWFALAFGMGWIGYGIQTLRTARDASWIFFASMLFVVPTAVVVATDPEIFFARYLIICYPWFFALVAIGLANSWRAGGPGRVLALASLAFFLCSNALLDARVLTEGGNDYRDTIEYIDTHTTAATIEFGSDDDFRNPTVLEFYARYLKSGRPVRYRPIADWNDSGPQWFLRHNWRAGSAPESRFTPHPGHPYQLVKSFPHGPGNGFQWFVYRRVDESGG